MLVDSDAEDKPLFQANRPLNHFRANRAKLEHDLTQTENLLRDPKLVDVEANTRANPTHGTLVSLQESTARRESALL
jgi:hypothetical protein